MPYSAVPASTLNLSVADRADFQGKGCKGRGWPQSTSNPVGEPDMAFARQCPFARLLFDQAEGLQPMIDASR
jgi:hypothetical protein